MDRGKLSENLVTIVPFMFKRFMKNINFSDISRPQIGLLFHICNENGRPMSHYSEKMMVPKSNLTVLTDKLIKEGYIDREFDQADRRIITLRITDKGREFLEDYKKAVRAEMLKKIEVYSDEEVTRLNELIEEMKTLFRKMDQ